MVKTTKFILFDWDYEDPEITVRDLILRHFNVDDVKVVKIAHGDVAYNAPGDYEWGGQVEKRAMINIIDDAASAYQNYVLSLFHKSNVALSGMRAIEMLGIERFYDEKAQRSKISEAMTALAILHSQGPIPYTRMPGQPCFNLMTDPNKSKSWEVVAQVEW